MKRNWLRLLHLATAILWLVIGVAGLLRGNHGFVPIAATISGMVGLAAAYLDRETRSRT